MHVPRLVSAACPSCGAGIRVDATCEVAVCRYCGRSSLIHRKSEPIRPPRPGQETFGHIHVQQSAGTIAWIIGLVTVMPVVFALISVVVGIVAMVVGFGAIVLVFWIVGFAQH